MWETAAKPKSAIKGTTGIGKSKRQTTTRRLPMMAIASLLGLLLVASIIAAELVLPVGGEGSKDLPSTPVGAENIVVRVSGTEGVVYEGAYASSFLKKDETKVEKATVRAEPTEYEVDLQEGKDKAVLAYFVKTQPGTEQLKVEIVADGAVAVEGSTNIEKGSVFIDWGLGDMPMPKISDLPKPPEFKAPPPPKVPPMPKLEPPPKPKMPPPPKLQKPPKVWTP